MAIEALQEDIVLGKAFDRRLLGRLLTYAYPYRGRMLAVAVLILVVTGLGLVGPYLIHVAIDGPLRASIEGAARGDSIAVEVRELLKLGLIFVAISVTLIGMRFLETYSMAVIGQKAMLDLRMELFAHLSRMPIPFYERNPVGRLVTRITSDVEALNELFASGVVTFVADVLVLVGITLLLFWANSTLTLITLLVIPLLIGVTFIFRRKAREFYREQRRHLAHLNAFTQESIQGMSILQVFHQEKPNLERYRKINCRYLRAFLKTVAAYSLYFPAIEVLSTFGLVAILWAGAGLLETGELTFGQFFLFWYFLGRFFQPIRSMAERYNVLQSAMASAERVFNILDTPAGIEVAPPRRTANADSDSDTPSDSDSDSDALAPVATGGAVRPLTGRVEFKNVWFAYQGEEYVLKDVSFVAEPGEMLAIVGATGAGKTTVINLLSRFYDPSRGAIELDGQDLRDMEISALRHRIGVVLQDVFLFSRSIEENIRLGTPGIDSSQVVQCAEHVNARRFVDRLNQGFDHVLAERGGELSTGEKQLLVFARALAHQPDLLILDEATAHVDTETELLIQDALKKLLAARTSIVIAHRLSTVRRANRILVLHKGELREEGTHDELVKAGGIYARLHELQYK